ncbi:ABC transporter substrate-binding protein [Candidatus Acetothermia bacterium]|nr:ABC transporter substrate-binding protein [Candidatus Acetothermia bacterium]MBI3461413.1 ABC transporter substrate-binding protein [Candidatus Acetothermia bacterium]MBI3658946.1 ABC transporter substrate-binding protein [Candidatus Acetothermia bacterium]
MRIVKLLTLIILLVAFDLSSYGCGQGGKLVSVVFQSKWFPQSQFAGYWVAGGHLPGEAPSKNAPKDNNGKNFYAQEGLDVTILNGGSVNPSVNVATGNADFGTDWIANMLVQRKAGLDLVHIGQIFQIPGYLFVAQKNSGIESVQGFKSKNVGVWAFGNEFPAQACFMANGLTSNLDPNVQKPDMKTTVYAFDPALVFPNKVNVASAMIYNELDQIVGLGFPLDQLSVVSALANGCGLLEDFIFTTRKLLESNSWKNTGLSGKELAKRFVRATLKGWQWAIENQSQAVKVVIDFCGDTCQGSGKTQSSLIHQAWQMARVAEMTQPSLMTSPEILKVFGLKETPPAAILGCLNLTDYDRTVKLLEKVGLISSGVGDPNKVVSFEILDAIGVKCPK